MPACEISRSVEIKSPPEHVFDVVADFGTWVTAGASRIKLSATRS